MKINKDAEKNKINEKHLDYIQTIIIRMAQNSFQCKSWGITVVTALLTYGLSAAPLDNRRIICIIACIVIALFGGMDTYYLYLERGYRNLYNAVAQIDVENNSIKKYDLRIPKEYKCWKNIIKALFSLVTGGFYLAIIVLIICLFMILR